jgi:thiamine biosynthesis lipoprotein
MNAAVIIAVLSLGSRVASGTTSDQSQSKWALELFQYSQLHMGVRVNISCYAPNQQTAERACSSVFKRFADLEAIMSDYRPDSEVMKLCDKAGNGAVAVSPDLYRVIARSQEVAELSYGAFDITCGPVVKLWREARKTKKGPSPFKLDEAKRLVGWGHIFLDPQVSTVDMRLSGQRIDLGGIAKGDGCDQALIELKANGVSRVLIEAGGDMVAGDPPPGRLGWKVKIRGGDGEEILLDNQALSTSGDSEQFVEIGGRRFSHIVDPRTGIGLTNRLQVSVLAKNGLTSDPLSTTLCILGEDKGKELLTRYQAKAWFVHPKGK